MKLNLEQAKAEFDKWLEFRKTRKSKIENYKEQGDLIIEAIADGDLVVKDDFTLEYQLLQPLKTDDDEVILSSLTFKPRMRKQDLISHQKGLKPNDADGRLLATIAALADKTPCDVAVNKQLIGKLDTEDISVCEAIALYFL